MARVLVIEDDEIFRSVLTTALVDAGHSVITAGNGREGLHALRVEHADLILTDIIMPEQDGIGLLLALRKERPGMPFIVMSGLGSNSALYLSMAEKLGARRTLAKPFSFETLVRVVDDVCREADLPRGGGA